ncbi:MAG: response regulator transcription factor [Tissierellia bacterium]|nr:response regulator transcription factor [Tissierellia bacterium]
MKILIVDDKVLFSESLKISLENKSNNYNITTVNKKEEFRERIKADYYNLIILSMEFYYQSEKNGLYIAKMIKQMISDTKIILLTYKNKYMYLKKSKELNIDGYIDISLGVDEFIRVIDQIVLKNEKVLKNELFINGKSVTVDSSYKHSLLTKKEIQVLYLLYNSEQIDIIASKLYISPRTVNNHINQIYKKLNVSNRQEAMLKAYELGYIEYGYEEGLLQK